MADARFDVFLCHNTREKAAVERIRDRLQQRGIYAWLDKYDFEPFRHWQVQLEEVIPQIKAAAIFLGASGIGPWADLEMRAFLEEFVRRKIRMGLVILPGCPNRLIQEMPIFLQGFHRVDFRQTTPDPMEQLIWGITGQKPGSNLNGSNQPNGTFDEPWRQVLHQVTRKAKEVNQNLAESVIKKLEGRDRPASPPTVSASLFTRGSSSSGVTMPVSPASQITTPSTQASNYSKLQNLLRAKRWRDANQETTKLIRDRVGGQPNSSLRVEDIKALPCEDLKTIAQLWHQHSNGHFGFAAQRQVWIECGSPVDFGEKWQTFSDRIGWSVHGQWLSDAQLFCDGQKSPPGELPRIESRDVPVLVLRVLFRQLHNCGL